MRQGSITTLAMLRRHLTLGLLTVVTLGAGQSVSVEYKFGEVSVHGESGRDVKISATIRVQANSREEAESFAQKIQIEVQQTSEGVRIKTNYPEEGKHWYIRVGRNPSYSVNYDIGMPSDAPLNVQNSFGSVDAGGVHGAADIENSHGSLTIRDGGAARLNNSFGSIELTGASGNVYINDNNGSVQASDVRGTLEVRNRFGSITAHKYSGSRDSTRRKWRAGTDGLGGCHNNQFFR